MPSSKIRQRVNKFNFKYNGNCTKDEQCHKKYLSRNYNNFCEEKGKKRLKLKKQQNIVCEQWYSKDFQRVLEGENKSFEEFDCVQIDEIYR